MAAKNVADDRVVYLAFNTIFQGQDSQIRKLQSIKRLVSKHTQKPQVAQLLEEYGETIIYEKLRKLLEGRVFENTVKAKCKFPELFEVSQAQSAERAISEAEAAAGHAKAVEEAIASSDSHVVSNKNDSDSGRTGEYPQAGASSGSPKEKGKAHRGISVPSLFPLEFQFVTGYNILVRTQQVLEFACYRFAEKAMPEILEKRKWHCPESAELNLWATEFLKQLGKLESKISMPALPSRPLKELFPSIAQIRHHAVHRIPVTAKELEQFMADSETLANLFEDSTAIPIMARARSEVHKAAAEMENRKNMLEARLAEVLQDVAEKRAEMDRTEVEAIADTERKDKEYQLFAGTQLQENIWLDDGTIEEESFAAPSPAAQEPVNGCFLHQPSTDLESEITPHEDSKMEDIIPEGPMSSELGENCIGGLDSQSIPAGVEEVGNESLGPADSDANGDRAATEKRELLSVTPEGITEPEVRENGWQLSRVFGITSSKK